MFLRAPVFWICRETPLEITCWRQGPWTGRGDDVSVVLDLMIHDLDLVHTLVPGAVVDVRAEGLIEYGPHADEVFALLRFANGTIAKLETSRVATERKRGLRAVYADGVVEIDFLSRTVRNTTPRPLGALELGDPLGESVAGFVAAAQAGVDALVTPEQAAQALETALWIEEASGVAVPMPARAGPCRGRPPLVPLSLLRLLEHRSCLTAAYRIALAQLNPVMGDIAGNLERARAARAPSARAPTSFCFPNFSSSAIRRKTWCSSPPCRKTPARRWKNWRATPTMAARPC